MTFGAGAVPAGAQAPPAGPPPELFDLHCHLDFAQNARSLAEGLAALRIGCLSVTMDPSSYEAAGRLLSSCPGVRVGLGLHPWRIADGSCGEEDVASFERLASEAPFVGEVGLDFSGGRESSRAAQMEAFDRIARACAAHGGKTISIHAVRSAGAVLDVLERHGCAVACACVFHWFSGTSDELRRAVRLGCYFSAGERMLSTKRGRAYARAVPIDRLVLETDAPPEPVAFYPAVSVERSLSAALARLEAERGDGLGAVVANTSRALLRLA